MKIIEQNVSTFLGMDKNNSNNFWLPEIYSVEYKTHM